MEQYLCALLLRPIEPDGVTRPGYGAAGFHQLVLNNQPVDERIEHAWRELEAALEFLTRHAAAQREPAVITADRAICLFPELLPMRLGDDKPALGRPALFEP